MESCVSMTTHMYPIPTESAVELMYSAKEAGGNPKSTAAHGKVDEKASLMQKAVNELTYTLEQAGGEAGLISGELVTHYGSSRMSSTLLYLVLQLLSM